MVEEEAPDWMWVEASTYGFWELRHSDMRCPIWRERGAGLMAGRPNTENCPWCQSDLPRKRFNP